GDLIGIATPPSGRLAMTDRSLRGRPPDYIVCNPQDAYAL
ncbi:unnamed protein product, partial [marine sediment metagenome]